MVAPENILKEHSPSVRQIVEQLRKVVRSTVPEMTEKAYPGWHGIGFRHPLSGYVCGIFPAQASVKLLFEHGVQLSDPHSVLQGAGKQTRHIEVARTKDITVVSIILLLLEAVALKSAVKSRKKTPNWVCDSAHRRYIIDSIKGNVTVATPKQHECFLLG